MKINTSIEQQFLDSLDSGIAPITIEEFIKELREIAQDIDEHKL